jgi:hypothetical protein
MLGLNLVTAHFGKALSYCILIGGNESAYGTLNIK